MILDITNFNILIDTSSLLIICYYIKNY